MENISAFEKRKQLAIDKGLIHQNDYTIYRHILNLYQAGFEKLLAEIVDFTAIDREIENSNLYFAPSKITCRTYANSNLNSKYFYCLNQFYVEKLSRKDISILEHKTIVDSEVINIIKTTFQDIITKEDAKMITYGQPRPERIIANTTIVLIAICGKNTEKLEKEVFIENMKKQDLYLESINKRIEKAISNSLNTPVKVLVDKMV